MILDVFDKNFNRIDNLFKYSYSHYEKELNSNGSFEIDIPLNDTALAIKSQGAFVLFERDTVGCITYFNLETDSETNESTMIIKGYLANCLLDRRCIYETINAKGTRTAITRQLVTDFFISPEDSHRSMPIVLATDPKYIPAADTEQLTVQKTGDSVQSFIESLLETNEMGYDIVPILTNVSIQNLEFRVIMGDDRTIGNSAGNPPVIFSSDLHNILRSTYIYNNNGYKNCAYVAGEGEGSERVIVDVGSMDSSGFDRYELYVDARDLQKTDGETTLTTEEYEQVLQNRGNSKLKECVVEEVYNASIDNINTQFVYGQDFFLGDLITIQDVELGIAMNARVTKVSATSLGEKDILDVTFGYYKLSTMKRLVRNGVI